MRSHSSNSRRRRLLLQGSDVAAVEEREENEDSDRSHEQPVPNERETIDATRPMTIPLRVDDVNQPWRSELRRLLDGMQPLTWVFTGDGVTQAAAHTDGHRGYAELFDARVRGGLRRLLDVVVNTGLEGGRVKTLHRNREWRIDRFRPDVVSLMVGFSDATAGEDGRDAFRDLLRQLVDELIEDGVVVVLNTPHRPSARAAAKYADLRAYVRFVREIADETGVPLVDHWAHWRRANQARLLGSDGLHPNAAGHAEIARLLQRELGVDGD